jgi:hypothetical protein
MRDRENTHPVCPPTINQLGLGDISILRKKLFLPDLMQKYICNLTHITGSYNHLIAFL